MKLQPTYLKLRTVGAIFPGVRLPLLVRSVLVLPLWACLLVLGVEGGEFHKVFASFIATDVLRVTAGVVRMFGLAIGLGTARARTRTPLLIDADCFNAAAALMSALAAVEREDRLKDDADDDEDGDEDDEEADEEDDGERDGEDEEDDEEEEVDSSGACPDSFSLMAALALFFADSIAFFTMLSL